MKKLNVLVLALVSLIGGAFANKANRSDESHSNSQLSERIKIEVIDYRVGVRCQKHNGGHQEIV